MTPIQIKNYLIKLLLDTGIYKDPSEYNEAEKESFEKTKMNLLEAIVDSYNSLCYLTKEDIYEDIFILDEEEVNGVENHPFKQIFYALWDLSLTMDEE